MKPRRYLLTISCPDTVGIVAGVSGFLAQNKGWIVEASYHSDPEAQSFFMRNEVLADSLPFGVDELRTRFEEVANKFKMTWKISDTQVKKRVVVLVSKEDHCLSDILHRWRNNELDFDFRAVISNHETLRGFVEWHGVPFHYIPVDKNNKQAAFALTDEFVNRENPDTIVLARYMQILPPNMCERYEGRVINIHHSFLPSFAGAKPYHQAYERGVKLIGATSHFATAELDAGPIIEQDVIRIDHAHSPEDMIRLGRDVEKTVLARALRYHLEDRILIHGQKTVVFK